ncbi:hypothetical protein E3Q23_00396 [Wallemia mellicola]|uniref:Apses-domain-containing protein n=1 Tax=Wallemia mellicola TaxID=1708541 RepID=A0A4T0TUY0_9BASI|nr:hypothetical protein E3Q23_00396 [Wallemia mellicola]TIC69005.1 apses-domain-containing protein [Wallemia mellicola]
MKEEKEKTPPNNITGPPTPAQNILHSTPAAFGTAGTVGQGAGGFGSQLYQSPYVDSQQSVIGSPVTPAPLPKKATLKTPQPRIYSAVYSGVGVYEAMIRGIAVMRRRADGYMNATQILKVAGVDKGRRTKILEREILAGLHEKIQGGYGKYQGTWIPFERGRELALQYGCNHLLAPIFDFNPSVMQPSAGRSAKSPSKKRQNSIVLSPTQERHQSSIIALNTARASGIYVGGADDPNDDGLSKKEKSPVKKSKYDEVPVNVSKRPYVPPPGTNAHILTRTQQSLTALFQQPTTNSDFIPEAVAILDTTSGALHPDLAIDELGHTALHWAASLGRISNVQQLIKKGADMKRGNIEGETPLERSVLVNDNYDKKTFAYLLQELGSSIRVVDRTGRSILHHIALIAAVNGRSMSAKYYMENVLEYIARYENGEFKSLVDLQDEHGDTALNISARVGNRNLVKMLVDAGANKTVVNKLGLKASDFGVEHETLNSVTGDEMLSNLQPPPPLNVDSSASVLENIHNLLNGITQQYTDETSGKNALLFEIQAELKQHSHELADVRKEIQYWQNKATQMAEVDQKIKNINEAIENEKVQTWSLLGEANADKMEGIETSSSSNTSEIKIPTEDNEESLKQLRKLSKWLEGTQKLTEERVASIDGLSASKEVKYKSIVSVCTGVPVNEVEGMLAQLLEAMESDANADLNKVQEFLAREC